MAANITDRPGNYVAARSPVVYNISATPSIGWTNYRVQLIAQYEKDSVWTDIGSAIQIYPRDDICQFNISTRMLSVMSNEIVSTSEMSEDTTNNCIKFRVKFREAYTLGGSETFTSYTIDEIRHAINAKVPPGVSQDLPTGWLSEVAEHRPGYGSYVSFIPHSVGDEVTIRVEYRDINDNQFMFFFVNYIDTDALINFSIDESNISWSSALTHSVVLRSMRKTSETTYSVHPEEFRIYKADKGTPVRFLNSMGGFNTIMVHRDLQAGYNKLSEDVYEQRLIEMDSDTSIEKVDKVEAREVMRVIYKFRGEHLSAMYDLFRSRHIEIYMDAWKRVRIEPGAINYRHGDVYGYAEFTLLFTKW